jgi:F0F1-type ATP synthase delta subunit
MTKQSRTKLAHLIAGRTLKDGVSKDLSTEIAAYLLSERRVSELDSVLRDVQLDWATAGQVEVIASSAHPLTLAVKVDITKQVKQVYPAAKQVIVTEVHNPEVLAGVRLDLPNRQLDLSAQAKLNTFKQLTTVGGSPSRNSERK